MPGAIILINTEIGAENEVLKKLTNIEGVKEVYEVYGMFDIVAKVEASSHEALREIVINRIRQIPQVKSTTTMLIIEEKKVE